MRFIYISTAMILVILIAVCPISAQVSFGGKPISLSRAVTSDIEVVAMPSIDIQALLAEDEIEEAQGMPYRFGNPFEVDYGLYNSGTWEELPDGSGLWRLKIKSPGAYSINLVYDRYHLPEGAELFIYNEDRSSTIGAFTSKNNKDHGRFATAPVPGDVCILEYREPAGVRGQGEIVIGGVVHAYKDIFDYNNTKELLDFGSSGSCNNNINCPEGEPWQKEKRSVAMILTAGGSRICTGALVNNVRQDGTPFFLTANHCLGTEETWLFMFNYESPTCDNIDGPTYMTVSGSTLLSTWTSSDFALLMLDETPPESYMIFFAGWSNENIASQVSTTIHHPRGDIKKISFDYDSVTSANYFSTTGTTHWRVGQWEDGTTEPGSSGAPLFDQNHRVVGQLHGGYASCEVIEADWYGKFSLSWTGGGTPSSRLSDWLDPDGTGATVLDGYDQFAGVNIIHTPLPNTRDTVNDYEVVCIITSAGELVADSLRLNYEIASVWSDEQLLPTGTGNEYHAFIPAQSAGTTINYFLTAGDDWGNVDSTPVYTFEIEYTPEIDVTPLSISKTLEMGDSTTTELIIANVGEGTLEYSIAVENADKSAGGPDVFGYSWIDSDDAGGPVFEWIDITATGIDITSGLVDDNYTGPYDIGFAFPYYDEVYTQFYIGSNGLIGFDSVSLDSRTKVSIPNDNTPDGFLAWLWDDLDITNQNNPGGQVFMRSENGRCIIQFVNYPEYLASQGDVVNAEVILIADGTLIFQYLNFGAGFDKSSCVVGIENIDGTDGIEVAYLTSYLHDGLAVRFDRPMQWLSQNKSIGAVGAGIADTIIFVISAAELDTGQYGSNIIISNNDPDPVDNPLIVPVLLTVQEESSFICGDIDGDEQINIKDITFVINYLYKGGPAPDPIEACDINSSTNCNLLDVTYLIQYLYKGGPAPHCQ